MSRRLALLAAAVLAALLPLAPSADAKPAKKPSIRVAGVSVNRWYVSKGTTVKLDDGTNGCYAIATEDGAPDDITAYFYVKGTKIPDGAPMTYTLTVPWDKQFPPTTYTGTYAKGLSKATKGIGPLWGGPTGTGFRGTYSMLPTGGPTSYFVSGKYAITVTVKVGGKTLTAKGGISVSCG